MNNVFLRTAAAFLSSLLFYCTTPGQRDPAGPSSPAAKPSSTVRTASTGDAAIGTAAIGDAQLKVILIRHAEKPKKGDNLTCQGINRSMELTPVLYSRFGLPVAIYVPAMHFGDNTKHSRMFQTIVPFAAKYNLPISGKFHEDDTAELAHEIREQKGTVFVVWEHSRLPAIAHSLGIQDPTLTWSDDDYDSIWIITWHDGVAHMERSSEGLHPSAACPY